MTQLNTTYTDELIEECSEFNLFIEWISIDLPLAVYHEPV